MTGGYDLAEWDIDLLFLGPEANTEGNKVYIDLIHAGPSFESVALTPNQIAVAAALDAAEAAGVGTGVVNLVLPALHEEDARQAYDSLIGEIYAQHHWASLGSMHDFVQSTAKEARSIDGGQSIWAVGYKGTGDIESQGDFMGASHDHQGIVIGWTPWSTDTWGFGVMGGTGDINVDMADLKSEAKANGQKFGAYGSYNSGQIGLIGQVVFGQDRFTINRDLVLLGNPLWLEYPDDDRSAVGEYESNNVAISFEGTYNYSVGGYDLKPTVGLHWFSFSRDGFTETGAGPANLVVEAADYSMAQGSLGLTISKTSTEDRMFAPEFRLGYMSNFDSFESGFTATFSDASGVPFEIEAETPGDSAFIAGASLGGKIGESGIGYELSYDAKFWSSTTESTMSGKLSYSF